MDVLPTDLLVDIFLRLPATTLTNSLRHVCRSWRAIISDPIFIVNHLEHSIDDEGNTALIFYRNSMDPSKGFLMYSSAGELMFPEPKRKLLKQKGHSTTILVCHGLVLYIYKYSEIVTFELCNPVLNQCISLEPITPATCGSRECEYDFGFGLFNDFGYWAFGFGFDPVKKQYKVIVISKTIDGSVRTSNVYCSTVDVLSEKKTISSWKRLGSLNHLVQSDSDGVLVNGRLNWLISDDTAFYGVYLNDVDLILSIDLNTEELSIFSRRANHRSIRTEFRHLGVLGGTKLCMYVTNSRYNWPPIEGGTKVFVMEDYGNTDSWNEYCYFYSKKRFRYDYYRMCYWKRDCFVMKVDSSRVNYMIVDNKMNKIENSIANGRRELKNLYFISTFLPCLVSLFSCES